MSDKEKEIYNKLKTLPATVQDRFLDQITGAAIAMEFTKAATLPGAAAQNDDEKRAG